MKTEMISVGTYPIPLVTPVTARSVLFRCLLLSVVVTVAFVLAGCSFTVHEPKDAGLTRRSTVGQELLDLKRAYDAGAISQPEYETKKAELLDDRR